MQSVKRANIPVVVVTALFFVAIASFVAFSTSRMVENEAYTWARNELLTSELAQEYILRQQQRQQLSPCVGAPPTPLNDPRREHINPL